PQEPALHNIIAMRRPWPFVILLFGLFLAAAGWLIYQRVAAGKNMPDYSVYSRDRKGLAGTAQWLSRIGYEPIAVTRPIQNTRYSGLLILVEPSYHGVAPE